MMRYYFNAADAQNSGVAILLIDDVQHPGQMKPVLVTQIGDSVLPYANDDLRYVGRQGASKFAHIGNTIDDRLTDLGRAFCEVHGVEPNARSVAKWAYSVAVLDGTAETLYGSFKPTLI